MTKQDNPHSRLYKIQNDAAHFHTGRMRNGNQILSGIQYPEIVLVEFDASGSLLRVIARPIPERFYSIVNGIYRSDDRVLTALIEQIHQEVGLVPDTITVQPFFLSERWIGIKDLPEHYQDVLDHPEDCDAERLAEVLEDVRLWKERADFVFYWSEDYYMNREGELESS